jgi:p-hydroxybenzoate 3-monooxygenase
MYFQCDPADSVENWPDERIWEELQTRVASGDFRLKEGPIFQKGIIPLRSFVCEPMQYGQLFLAGDAAHSVPPTGAKGLNLAAADVHVLARALSAYYASGSTDLLDAYSRTTLGRVWRAQHFSWWMTSMLHRFWDANEFDLKRQLAELTLVTTSRAAATTVAENYVGMPLTWPTASRCSVALINAPLLRCSRRARRSGQESCLTVASAEHKRRHRRTSC